LAILNSELIARLRTVATISNGRKGEFGGHPTASVAGRPKAVIHHKEQVAAKRALVACGKLKFRRHVGSMPRC
jgi:hypothetical protein